MPDDTTNENELPTTTVIIDRRHAAGVDATVTITINGVSQEIPVGVATPVRDDMLEALTNSDRTFTVVDSDGGAAGASTVGDTDDMESGKTLPKGSVTGNPATDGDAQEDPAGGRSGANDRIAPTVDKDTTGFQYAPAPGAFGATGDENKSLPPETPLTREQQGEINGGEGDEDEREDELGSGAEQFDAADFVDRTVDEVKADLANLDAAKLDSIHTAESTGQNRSTLLAAIDAAKGKLAE